MLPSPQWLDHMSFHCPFEPPFSSSSSSIQVCDSFHYSQWIIKRRQRLEDLVTLGDFIADFIGSNPTRSRLVSSEGIIMDAGFVNNSLYITSAAMDIPSIFG